MISFLSFSPTFLISFESVHMWWLQTPFLCLSWTSVRCLFTFQLLFHCFDKDLTLRNIWLIGISPITNSRGDSLTLWKFIALSSLFPVPVYLHAKMSFQVFILALRIIILYYHTITHLSRYLQHRTFLRTLHLKSWHIVSILGNYT